MTVINFDPTRLVLVAAGGTGRSWPRGQNRRRSRVIAAVAQKPDWQNLACSAATDNEYLPVAAWYETSGWSAMAAGQPGSAAGFSPETAG